MAGASAIYEGWVAHRRHRPRSHGFRYRQGLLYIDLDELPGLLDAYPMWSARKPAPAWIRRKDYYGPAEIPLADAVRAEIAHHSGSSPRGPIRLLTHPRYWGVGFNPVSFYYIFAPDGERLQWVLADVSNTPWQERHAYVLGPLASPDTQGEWRPVSRKVFHVSPFMAMDMEYRWLLQAPADKLLIGIENHDSEGKLFDATLSLQRRSLSKAALDRLLWGYPWQSVKVLATIYWQALRLWAKRIPYVPHPDQSAGEKR